MKRILLIATAALVAAGTFCADAQKKKDPNAFEEATARKLDPEVRVFIRPMVCDMEMLTTEREKSGPYPYPIKGLDQISDYEFQSLKSRALYQAAKEANADAVLEPIFFSYVKDKEPKVMYIEVTGYPVKYTNFHPLKDSEVEMVEKIYTRSLTNSNENQEREIIRSASYTEKSQK